MWIIIKYNLNNDKIFSKEVNSLFCDSEIFIPKIKLIETSKKSKEVNILGNYLFFFYKKMEKINYLNFFKNIKGVNFVLPGAAYAQKEILFFINRCREHSSKDGYINPSFFYNYSFEKAEFINGPFKGSIFKIIKNEKNKIKILINNILTTVYKNNTNYYYKLL